MEVKDSGLAGPTLELDLGLDLGLVGLDFRPEISVWVALTFLCCKLI